jgi:hypothetical protein
MERARQFTYAYQHPHSRVTNQGRRESQHVEPNRKIESQHVDTNGRRESQHVDTKGDNNNFYNKLRKPGLELETLGSDTMSSFMH